MVPWYHGTMAAWQHGTMAPWHHGTMAPWCHGTTVSWLHGTMVPWYDGATRLKPGSIIPAKHPNNSIRDLWDAMAQHMSINKSTVTLVRKLHASRDLATQAQEQATSHRTMQPITGTDNLSREEATSHRNRQPGTGTSNQSQTEAASSHLTTVRCF